MKRKIIAILLALTLVLAMSATCFADSLKGKDGWYVEYTADKEIKSSFKTEELSDALAGMQPGDDLTVTITVKNSCGEEIDWYMLNEIVKSLEDTQANASGGAYTYILKYKSSAGEDNELFNSKTVGGEGGSSEAPEGLHGVDSALKDYLYLERMASGGEGTLTLLVAFDGESQGNGYQDSKASLKLRFAVEEVPTKKIVTGDTTKNNSGPLKAVMTISGILALILAVIGIAENKKARKNAKKIVPILLAILLVAGASGQAFAAGTTYKVRVFAGDPDVGALKSGETYEEQVEYGKTFSFDTENVEVKDERYFVKGIREAGKDNSYYASTSLKITKDMDYVVAYGMKSSMVRYTVNYVDADGQPLGESRTFYGNAGDKPVVAFQYFENYRPQAYNLTKTLSEDESENVFTFRYTYVEPGAAVIVVPGGPGGGQGGGQGGQEGQEGQQGGQEGQQGGQEGQEGQQGGQEGQEGQQGGQEPIPEIIDIDEPETPTTDNPDNWFQRIPTWGKVAAGVVVVGGVIAIIAGKKKDDDDEDKNAAKNDGK